MSEEAKKQNPEADVATAPETEQAATAELTIQDLQSLKQIIDVSTQRGAFKGGELMTVGQVYNKLEAFLNSVTQQQSQGE